MGIDRVIESEVLSSVPFDHKSPYRFPRGHEFAHIEKLHHDVVQLPVVAIDPVHHRVDRHEDLVVIVLATGRESLLFKDTHYRKWDPLDQNSLAGGIGDTWKKLVGDGLAENGDCRALGLILPGKEDPQMGVPTVDRAVCSGGPDDLGRGLVITVRDNAVPLLS